MMMFFNIRMRVLKPMLGLLFVVIFTTACNCVFVGSTIGGVEVIGDAPGGGVEIRDPGFGGARFTLQEMGEWHPSPNGWIRYRGKEGPQFCFDTKHAS